jgi:hypothetical protein
MLSLLEVMDGGGGGGGGCTHFSLWYTCSVSTSQVVNRAVQLKHSTGRTCLDYWQIIMMTVINDVMGSGTLLPTKSKNSHIYGPQGSVHHPSLSGGGQTAESS